MWLILKSQITEQRVVRQNERLKRHNSLKTAKETTEHSKDWLRYSYTSQDILCVWQIHQRLVHHMERSDWVQTQNNRISKAQCPSEKQPLAVWQLFQLLIEPLCSTDWLPKDNLTRPPASSWRRYAPITHFSSWNDWHLLGFLKVFFKPPHKLLIWMRLTTAAIFAFSMFLSF